MQTATNDTTSRSARQTSSLQHLVLFCHLSPARRGSGIHLQGITRLCPNTMTLQATVFLWNLICHLTVLLQKGQEKVYHFCLFVLFSFLLFCSFSLLYPRRHWNCTTPAAGALLTVGYVFKETLLLVGKPAIWSPP